MVATSILAKARNVAGAFAALATMAFTTPALANSSAAADVNATLRAAQPAKPQAQGDDEFRRLFSNWKSLDKASVTAVTAAAATSFRPRGVSVPSRMPVMGAALTSSYGMRIHPVLGGRRAHNGIDLAMPTGTPVYATADAVVSKAERFSSYGLYVALEHGGEIQTRYGHLSRIAVGAGQQVRKGDVIGYVGSTGRSTGPHLHYEVRVNGLSVNPVPYLQGDGQPAPQLAITDRGPMGDGEE
ncbi:murein DD-endopeptidase MepM/ murein hydrolase activator NlpD [Novosphingobium kunmingense]|uniref:Murein DD-endopeptidase MepM/ murein hydrolase activator NlpD n=2 Tax=Novosphingobium kunmingense TaxID=1211806 RepID=A0A2N0HK33_9SPHN|nr:murein DD-endopeptidase MepM/ murein hydrolase activator NlpD [Novosphingobium kunmingense]